MHYRHGVHDSTTIHPDHTVSWVGLRASVKGTSPVDSDTGRGMYGNAHPLGGGGPDVLGAGDIKAHSSVLSGGCRCGGGCRGKGNARASGRWESEVLLVDELGRNTKGAIFS